ncbi:ATP-binding cassette subfamily B protein [Caulobacter ginsengisoli]|uniref:ATP-binding cassette subfamily B protein n=1 Tax=Caulobacter ginsengisoli TaxID=400775 RepID=A0ABU0IY74_9CAUL|nr:ABC transporter ATP-binding protein [Caulobacter ginsengisoli]MDQ0466959.1 ATP-binding cassette subfamily B protein [Caulobacter ginsengisoli]
MSDIDEDEDGNRRRVLSNGQVMAFIAGFWLRRPLLLLGAVGGMLVAVLFDLMLPTASGRLIDTLTATTRDTAKAWWAWAAFLGVYVGFTITRNIGFRFWNPLAARNMQEMSDEGFKRVQAFSADWHADTFAGATVRRLSRAMWGYDSVSDAVVLWLGPALIVLFGLSLQMMFKWPLIGLLAMTVVAGFLILNLWVVKVYVRPANLRSNALDSRIGGALADAITANPTVKAFGAEPREEARFAGVTAAWSKAVQVTWGRFMDIWLAQNILMVLLLAGMTGMVVDLWSHGRASTGDVVYAITAFLQMSGYLRNIGENVRMMQKGIDDVEDVAGYARMAPQVADVPDAGVLASELGEIVFDHVTFRYKSAAEPLYEDFSLTLAPGERVALVGATGAGKSTFVKLIQRLYDLDAGRILIDGQDIAKVSQQSLRRAIALVPQDPALFHRSIAENIAYARPGATEEEVRLAARRARAEGFIDRLPLGYDTLVGERGVKLSGGERQRVAIARAFLADAPILVFDEATSSLDVETERAVQAAMEELMAGRTTIVIAHRLSTIRGADRILVFENGRIVEEGRHGDLRKKGGLYARLAAMTEGTA